MSDYEIEEALQLRNQRFVASLRFATTNANSDDFFMEIEEAIVLADVLIAKLEEPTIKPEDEIPYG